MLVGDRVRLRQILINLAGNAVKFTSDGGSLKICLQLEHKKNNNYTLLFRVTDTGIGIAKDKLTSIFDSFTQASNDTTRKFGGTGLGLTISKQFVELQGGHIWVTSELNKGSCFHFTLPFEKGEMEVLYTKTESTTEPSDQELQHIHILLAEDNVMNQLLAKKIFKKWNCSFDIADNGKIVIDKLLAKKYDIILMDMQMPYMDGYETTKHIRNKMSLPQAQIPIIAMTAHALVGESDKCIALGMNDYISKPYNQQTLYEKIKQLTISK